MVDSGLGTRDSGLGTRDSGLGTRDSGLGFASRVPRPASHIQPYHHSPPLATLNSRPSTKVLPMFDLLAARSQMAVSLIFHIIFAAIGIAMPLLMVISEWRWMKTGDKGYLTLARRWGRGTAILFAVGAVSGTVLSFELGLLWPGFMGYAGAIIGMPFSLEGFAFFTEAIFLGIYLYGWTRVPPRAHLFAGAMVALSGALSGIFVVIANAWMNAPTGFRLVDGKPVDIDPIAAMMNPAALPQTLHMTLAALSLIHISEPT